MDQLERKAAEELYRRYTNEKFRYYAPNGKIEEFLEKFGAIDELGLSKYLINALIAANGIGKTTVIANICANLCFPGYNAWFKQELFVRYPYTIKAIRIVSDPTTIKTTIIPEMHKWFPQGRYTTDKVGKSYEYMWNTDTGWTIELMTYDQSLKEFESANVSVILLDEPPPYAIYMACISRLRNGGVMGLLFTPLTGSAWAYDEFNAKSPQQLAAEHKSLTTAHVEDACIYHAYPNSDGIRRGHLDHYAIERMVANYPQDEYLPRVEGKFQKLSGLVIKEFDAQVHVIEPFDITYEDYVVAEAYDSHPRHPDAILYIAVDRFNTWYVIDEVSQNMTEAQAVAKIKQKREGRRMVAQLLEPAAFNKDQHSAYSFGENLNAKYKLGFEPGSKARHEAIKQTQNKFFFQRVGNKFNPPPKIYVFSTCINFIREITHWQWQEWTGINKYEKAAKEQAEDKGDHLMECLGRIILRNPKWTPPPLPLTTYSGSIKPKAKRQVYD